MKHLWLWAAFSLVYADLASAQSMRLHQTGKVTPGHITMWDQNGQARDAGPAAAGLLDGLNIIPFSTQKLAPFCINSAPISSPAGYYQYCIKGGEAPPSDQSLLLQGGSGSLLLQGDAAGKILLQSPFFENSGATMSYAAYGGAQPLPFKLQADGSIALASGAGVVEIANLPQTTAGDVAVCIDPATGQLYQASATTQTFLIVDDAHSVYLTDDDHTHYLATTVLAGRCQFS